MRTRKTIKGEMTESSREVGKRSNFRMGNQRAGLLEEVAFEQTRSG